MRKLSPAAIILALAAAPLAAQEPLPPRDPRPVVVYDGGGPAAKVDALAFAPDGKTLYAAGLDKVIRVYKNGPAGWAAAASVRVPVLPGQAGRVTRLAVSPDGKWLAAAGRGPARNETGSRDVGIRVDSPAMSDDQLADQGVIYLFDAAAPGANGKVLRGHRGVVRGLAFLPGNGDATLASAAVEPGPAGVVRVWDVAAGRQTAIRSVFPPIERLVGLGGRVAAGGATTVFVGWPDPAGKAFVRRWVVKGDTTEVAKSETPGTVFAVLSGDPAVVVSGGWQVPGNSRLMFGETSAELEAGERPEAAAALKDGAVAVTTQNDRAPNLVLFNRDGTVADRYRVGAIDPREVVLAGSPDGSAVAVAGFADHHIEVVSEPRNRAAIAKTILRGGNAGYAGVEFVKAGAGLRLTDAAGKTTVFDFAKRAVVPAAYAPDAAPPGAVTAAVDPDGLGDVTVSVGGKPVRKLVGHAGTVGNIVAFAKSRPLAATAGADGTVRVWNLTDLAASAVGMIDGLVVADAGGRVVVRVAAGGLAAGDVVEAVGPTAEAVRPVKSWDDFAWRVRLLPPGGDAAVKIAGKAAAVKVPVGRGIDVRNPLFTLAIDPPTGDWVGWSPAGPYDASRPEAEARIGWLAATGDPAGPATFAAAGQYRNAFYKFDLLRFLAAAPDPAAGFAARDKEYGVVRPRIAVTFPGGVPGGADAVVVRPGPVRILVTADRPGGTVARVRVRGREDWTTLAAGPGGWAGDAFTAPARGPVELDVELRDDATDLLADWAGRVVAAPPPPDLRAAATASDAAGRVTVTATAAAAAGETAVVTVTDPATGKWKVVPPGGAVVTVNAALTAVAVRAVNAAAPAETRAAETAARTFDVTAVPAAPYLSPLAFAPEPRHADAGVVVDEPVVTVSGKVISSFGVPKLTVADGPAAADVPLMTARGHRVFCRELAPLRPGEARRVAFAAEAGGLKSAAETLVTYLPPLPALHVVAVPGDGPAGAFAGTFTRKGAEPFRAAVRLTGPRGTVVVHDVVVDDAAGTWGVAAVALVPGRNLVTFELKNKYAAASAGGREVNYRPTPVVRGPVDVAAGVARLRVRSPAELPVVEILIDDRPAFVGTPAFDKTEDAWVVSVAVPPGAKRVTARNENGESPPEALPPTAAAAGGPPRLARLPEAAATHAATAPVRVRATAAGGTFTRAEIWACRPGGRYTRVKEFPRGAADLDDTADVPLADGDNRVWVVVATPGGTAEQGIVVSRTPTPAGIVMDRVVAGAVSLPRAGAGFAAADGPDVKLVGRVAWPHPGDRPDGVTVAVSVNGIGHEPVPLGPPAGGFRAFEVPAYLNAKENVVKISLVAGRGGPVPAADSRGAVFAVGCSAVPKMPRLHVLTFAPGLPPRAAPALALAAMRAVGGTAPDVPAGPSPVRISAPGFEEVLLYAPRVDDVGVGQIQSAMHEAATDIRRRAGKFNDVVLIYFQGEDFVDRAGRRYLRTSACLPTLARADWPDKAVPVDALPATAGARVLVLGVPAGDPAPPAVVADLSVLRYGWRDGAETGRTLDLFRQALAANNTLRGIAGFVTADPAACTVTHAGEIDLRVSRK